MIGFAQISADHARAAQLSPTTHRMEGNPKEVLHSIEEFLRGLGCQVERHEQFALHAHAAHPDGCSAVLRIQCHRFSAESLGDVCEWTRLRGDPMVHDLLWQLFGESANGPSTPLHRGQLMPPAPKLQPMTMPPDVTPFFLDARGTKRTRADLVAA